MGELSVDIPLQEKPPTRRLDSWKEIAAYLKRDVTTVQRWERREGMPVHRHLHDKRGSVYALPEELEGWIQSRKPRPEEAEINDEPGKDNVPGRNVAQPETVASGQSPTTSNDNLSVAGKSIRLWVILTVALCLSLSLSGS
jgi:hypothetical protein